jgi:hypothetical protein
MSVSIFRWLVVLCGAALLDATFVRNLRCVPVSKNSSRSSVTGDHDHDCSSGHYQCFRPTASELLACRPWTWRPVAALRQAAWSVETEACCGRAAGPTAAGGNLCAPAERCNLSALPTGCRWAVTLGEPYVSFSADSPQRRQSGPLA